MLHDPSHVPQIPCRTGDNLTATLVAFGAGRFLSAWIMRFITPNKLMALFSAINVALVTIGIMFPGWGGMLALLLTSFFMSLMYPTIFATSIKGLGPNTKIGGSVLVMAIIGGALCTPAMGYIAEITGSMAIAPLPRDCIALFKDFFLK